MPALPIVEYYLLSAGAGVSRATCQRLSEPPSSGLQKTGLDFHFFFHSTGVPFMFENWKRVFFSVEQGCVCPLAHLFLISWLERTAHQKEQKKQFLSDALLRGPYRTEGLRGFPCSVPCTGFLLEADFTECKSAFYSVGPFLILFFCGDGVGWFF